MELKDKQEMQELISVRDKSILARDNNDVVLFTNLAKQAANLIAKLVDDGYQEKDIYDILKMGLKNRLITICIDTPNGHHIIINRLPLPDAIRALKRYKEQNLLPQDIFDSAISGFSSRMNDVDKIFLQQVLNE